MKIFQSGRYFSNTQSLPEFEMELESKVREKYDNWVKSNWTNSLGRPITDWKTVLKKAMPFIKNNESSLASKSQIFNAQKYKLCLRILKFKNSF
jgi:hypothetical protein